jgi:hypothetical protein
MIGIDPHKRTHTAVAVDDREPVLGGRLVHARAGQVRELSLTRSAFDSDPDAEHLPIARIGHDTIRELVTKLGGDPATAMFGAFRDAWASDEVPSPDYPADETDEG